MTINIMWKTLEVEPDGRVCFTMKRTFEDGTAARKLRPNPSRLHPVR